MKKKIIAEDGEHLITLVGKEIELNGSNCNLNHIDVSKVTDMGFLFSELDFNGDISEWDTSNVTRMDGMFKLSNFNGDISRWNVSKVEDMREMFESSKFNGDISKWDVSSLIYLEYTFKNSNITCDISDWKPYKLESIFHGFLCSVIPMPYWADYKDKDERMKVINAYHIEKGILKELNEELNTNDINKSVQKKIKL